MIPLRAAVPSHAYEPTVRDVMHYAHCTLAPNESLARAHEKMRLFRASELAVVEDDRLVGIVTADGLHSVRASSRGVTASAVMVRTVVAVDPRLRARDILRIAAARGATHVAVVHRGAIIGTFAIERANADAFAVERSTRPRKNRRS